MNNNNQLNNKCEQNFNLANSIPLQLFLNYLSGLALIIGIQKVGLGRKVVKDRARVLNKRFNMSSYTWWRSMMAVYKCEERLKVGSLLQGGSVMWVGFRSIPLSILNGFLIQNVESLI